MQASDIPSKFQKAFGEDATTGFIRTVPETTADAAAASLTLGFPPQTFLQIGDGGTPPDGRDVNGILFQISAWTKWLNAGGPVPYDGTFQTSVSGYPKGAFIKSATTDNLYWLSTVDGNTTNPDTGGAGWVCFSPVGVTRIVTASGAFTTTLADETIGLNRTTSVAASSTTLPASPVGKKFKFVDLAANFNAFPVTITAPAGQTFPEGLAAVSANVNRQTLEVQYFGSNIWSVKLQ